MHCSRPIAVHSLQVGVRLRDQAWGEVTKWLHPECAKPANVAKLKGFDELAPADQERLRSLAQDESPSLVSEPHRKRIRCVDQAQPTACSPATPVPVAAPPCRSETEWLRGCFDACTLAAAAGDGDGGGDGGDEHLLHHLARLEQAYRSRLPASLAQCEEVGFNLARGRAGAQARLAMLFNATSRKERLGPDRAKAVFKALAGPNPQGQCWKGWRQSGFGETQLSGPKAAVQRPERRPGP
mgnify:CR=1 FL=1